ncbi:hypothetical protein ROJ8625_03524 [Roseivivax jejudonensis]|uniref:Tellurite resistance protein TerB n=1 Tax=Roseivivax jejudonensis TaxID=1529041 RepID=A0A1X7A1Q4_9RHOB|nr:hypothetical protein [Roseivivax jejudonensis]SLN68139.1 hypothetical protein ROJ8625_03524 [Roseivivax jejudonensis]
MSIRLIFWASRPDQAWLDPADTPLALGALAVRLDDTRLFSRIDDALARRYDLTRREAAEMRRACEEIAAHLPEPPHYESLVARHVPAEERAAFAQCLWRVADDARDCPRAVAALARSFGVPEGTVAPVGHA